MPEPGPIDAFLDERHQRLAVEVTAWTAAEIAPLGAPRDDADGRQQARDVLARLGAGGWCRYVVPAAHGGAAADLDLRACCLVREALAAASPLADAVFALQALGTRPLVLAGGDKLRDEWLPQVAHGRVMTAFAMTEPGAGSDVASLETRAVRDGDHYVLDGRKAYISNAGIADLYTVFATTDPEAGSRGITAFVVPADRPGLVFAGAQILSAPHPLGEIVFEACRVPRAHRLGAEGEGFKIGMQTLDRLRVTVAAAACGMAGRALELALAWARERRQFGRPLARFQLIQQKLARMATELAAARLLTYRAARHADAGGHVTLEAAQAKLYATEAAQRIVDDAVQIHGGAGVLADHPVDHLYRAVRALRIYEGTSEIQHLVIARELLREE